MRVDLANFILKIKGLGVKDIFAF